MGHIIPKEYIDEWHRILEVRAFARRSRNYHLGIFVYDYFFKFDNNCITVGELLSLSVTTLRVQAYDFLEGLKILGMLHKIIKHNRAFYYIINKDEKVWQEFKSELEKQPKR